jgi:hypothetical protein
MNSIKGIKETEFWFKQLDEARNADKRSKLTEAPVSTTEKANAAKRFRAAVKAQERHGLLPVDDFHAAFDDELHALLDDATYESLFNADGTLKHRGTYGIIKKLDQTNPVVKALVKFWALQFSLDQMLPDAKAAWDKEAADREARYNKYEAERKAKEEENKKAFDLKVKDLQVEADKEAEEHFKNYRYGDFKKEVAQAVVDELEPFKKRYEEIIASQCYVEALKDGAAKASIVANKTLNRVKDAVGLLRTK